MRDISGKLVYSNKLNVNRIYQDDLDFTFMVKGVYFMQIRTAESVEVKKLIIQ